MGFSPPPPPPLFEVLNHIAPGAAGQTALLGPLSTATAGPAGSSRVWSERRGGRETRTAPSRPPRRSAQAATSPHCPPGWGELSAFASGIKRFRAFSEAEAAAHTPGPTGRLPRGVRGSRPSGRPWRRRPGSPRTAAGRAGAPLGDAPLDRRSRSARGRGGRVGHAASP